MSTQPYPPWKDDPRNMGRNIYRMCGYMAMFPARVPNYFIKKYSRPGDVVFDPFSGRGTTVIEACFEGRNGVGCDRNPLAYVLTKAQTSVPSKGRVLHRIAELETMYANWSGPQESASWEVELIFHKKTLRQLTFLRKQLNWKTSTIDAYLAALLMGILHGHSESYLSLPMPNTFSYSPNYIKKYVAEHGLVKPERDAFALLRKKLDRCYEQPAVKGKAILNDARRVKLPGQQKANLIMTSPPYTRLITYAKFNWIRLWALGFDAAADVERQLFTTSSETKYYDFMTQVLSNCDKLLARDGKLILVIGDVPNRDKSATVNLAEQVWKNCAQPLGFKKVEETIADVISDANKVTKIWGKTRGNATKVDRVLVLAKC